MSNRWNGPLSRDPKNRVTLTKDVGTEDDIWLRAGATGTIVASGKGLTGQWQYLVAWDLDARGRKNQVVSVLVTEVTRGQ